jgi:DNA-binding GntR family transcriptional regulator
MMPANVPEGSLQHRSLVDLAIDEVQRLIFAGVYNPGDPLRELELTAKLGTSRAPLREALRVLEQRGIVEQLPRRGYRVVTFSDRDMEEIYSLRDALDRYAVELAFPDPDPAGLAVLRSTMDDMRRAADERNHAALVLANRRFHVALVAMGGNARLRATYEGLMDQMQLCMSANLRVEANVHGGYETAVHRHAHLLAIIEGGDPTEVLAALAAHGSRDFVLPLVVSPPGPPSR